jgi:hypothetical protein
MAASHFLAFESELYRITAAIDYFSSVILFSELQVVCQDRWVEVVIYMSSPTWDYGITTYMPQLPQIPESGVTVLWGRLPKAREVNFGIS